MPTFAEPIARSHESMSGSIDGLRS